MISHPDDAFAFLLKELRANTVQDQQQRFDLIIEYAVWRYIEQFDQPAQRVASGWGRHQPLAHRLWPLLADAANDLVRRGVLRPGQRGEPNGTGLEGFTLTSFGREWLQKADSEALAITLPGRFEQLIAPLASKFGDSFRIRAVEAIRAYHAQLYLACCTMCGAASESILLALAVRDMGQESTLKIYDTRGRNDLKTKYLALKTDWQRTGFERHFNILGYARDDAAHGKASTLAEHDAFLSLLTLFRLAQFTNKEF